MSEITNNLITRYEYLFDNMHIGDNIIRFDLIARLITDINEKEYDLKSFYVDLLLENDRIGLEYTSKMNVTLLNELTGIICEVLMLLLKKI